MKTTLFMLIAAVGVLAQSPDPVESTGTLCPDGATCLTSPTDMPTMTSSDVPSMTLDEPIETGDDSSHHEDGEDMDHDHSTMTGDMESGADETASETAGETAAATETPGAASGLLVEGMGMAALVGAIMVAL